MPPFWQEILGVERPPSWQDPQIFYSKIAKGLHTKPFRSVVHPKAGSHRPTSPSPRSAKNRSCLGRYSKGPEALPGECRCTHLRDSDLQHGPLGFKARLFRKPKALGPDHMPSEATLSQRAVGGPRASREQMRARGCQAANAGIPGPAGAASRRHVAPRRSLRVATTSDKR